MRMNNTNFNTWTVQNMDTLYLQTAYPDIPTIQIHQKSNIFYPPALRNSGIKVKGKVMKSSLIHIVQPLLLLSDKLQFIVGTPYSTLTYVTCTTNSSA